MRNLSALRARLRQAGLQPASELPAPPPRTVPIPADWPGRTVASPLGSYFLLEQSFAPGYLHGGSPLSPPPAFRSASEPFQVPEEIDPSRLVFMDTETTGLAGGAGTLAFLVGVGFFEQDRFRVRQYFLPDPAGEAAMLEDSLTAMEESAGLVTFNGRAFDVPILQARAILRLRRRGTLQQLSHLDLLPHARRVWRRRLESCALGSLEREVLGVRRSVEDVPGSLIPSLYRAYLQNGDPQHMEGVLYHNVQDILSLAVLMAVIRERYLRPPEELADPLEALSLASAYRQDGRPDLAEGAFRAALQGELPDAERTRALAGLAFLQKRRSAWAEAAELWAAWHRADPEDPLPCIELAKHYEWRERDYAQALSWADRARQAARGGPSAAKRAVEHRIKRLKKKQSRSETAGR